MSKTANTENLIVNKSEWEKMKKQVECMNDTLFGNASKKSGIVYQIINAINNKIDLEKIGSRQVTTITMGAIIILLCVVIIFLICYFQGQLADVSDLCIVKP